MTADAAPVVVVVGSLHYDIMVDAPDRPMKGETVAGYSWRPKFGGKGGNQAVAAGLAGAAVRMGGAVGDDDFGRFLVGHLDRANVDRSWISIKAATGSGMSVAISDAGGDYGAVIVSGANLSIDPLSLANETLWAGAKALVLQNEVPEAINVAAARAARGVGAVVCLNAAPYRDLSAELRGLIDVLIVNAIEAEQLCGVAVDSLATAGDAAVKLATEFPVVVVTAGGDGVVGCRNGEVPVELPAIPVKLVSTHGAGDVFVGTLAASFASGCSWKESVQKANVAAAAHVSAKAGQATRI